MGSQYYGPAINGKLFVEEGFPNYVLERFDPGVAIHHYRPNNVFFLFEVG